MLNIADITKMYGEALEARNAAEASKERYKAEARCLYAQADAEADDEAACAIIEQGDEFAELEDRAERKEILLDDLVSVLSRAITLWERGEW
jgi:hypothetical protein